MTTSSETRAAADLRQRVDAVLPAMELDPSEVLDAAVRRRRRTTVVRSGLAAGAAVVVVIAVATTGPGPRQGFLAPVGTETTGQPAPDLLADTVSVPGAPTELTTPFGTGLDLAMTSPSDGTPAADIVLVDTGRPVGAVGEDGGTPFTEVELRPRTADGLGDPVLRFRRPADGPGGPQDGDLDLSGVAHVNGVLYIMSALPPDADDALLTVPGVGRAVLVPVDWERLGGLRVVVAAVRSDGSEARLAFRQDGVVTGGWMTLP